MQSKTLKTLQKYFKKERSVVLAFVFGSFAKGVAAKDSDCDIAVYLSPADYKTKKQELQDKIYLDMARIVKKEIGLVCLNTAQASLVSNIFKTGIALVIKDKKLYWELYLKTSLEAEDFFCFAKDFLEIYQKAKSLAPEEKTKLMERFQLLDSELEEIETFQKLTFKEYQEEKIKRRNIERWAENIINALIDISKIVLASEKKRMPRAYEESLFDFGMLMRLDEKESRKFARFANLRNILAHEYLDILYERIQRFIREFPAIYIKIFEFLNEYLK